MSDTLKYLNLLSKDYPNVQSAASELINLSAILNLPKGTEYFIADIHGEYDAFNHFLKNASGIIMQKIKERFPDYTEEDQNTLAFFIYYPTDMISKYQKKLAPDALHTLLRQMIKDMVTLARTIVIKYTQSKVRKAMPQEFAYVMQELLYESRSHEDKKAYYEAIIDAVFETKRANKLLLEFSRLIRRLAIDRLHIVGDIFDRGPFPHLVMEQIMKRRHVDIQWGNHDLIWMGAASGSLVCIANVIRIAARYHNLDCLEDGYGINLRPLATFAMHAYQNDDARIFKPQLAEATKSLDDLRLVAKMHKAITIIQFKLERDVFINNPEFHLEDRLLLDKVDPGQNQLVLEGKAYKLKDTYFPTVDFAGDPYALTQEEMDVMQHLRQVFLHNEMLQKHVKYLFQKGSMYLKTNQTLLFHAAIPLEADGTFKTFNINGSSYSGKALMDFFEEKIRYAYLHRYDTQNPALDYFVYGWCGPLSPLFAKDAMKTFERYFLEDKTLQKEAMDPYFTLRTNSEVLNRIFKAFGLDENKGKLINGHVPHDITQGDDVVLANKKIYLIDGGMSKQYVKRTAIGGYTLISDSYAFFLVSHSRFETYQTLIESERDIITITHSEDLASRRSYIYDTDNGKHIQEKIDDLKQLIEAYRQGKIKEQAA